MSFEPSRTSPAPQDFECSREVWGQLAMAVNSPAFRVTLWPRARSSKKAIADPFWFENGSLFRKQLGATYAPYLNRDTEEKRQRRCRLGKLLPSSTISDGAGARRDRRRDHGAIPPMRCSKARSRLYTEIGSTIVVQLFTRYWNELSTLPKARTICCMTPSVITPFTMVGPRAI